MPPSTVLARSISLKGAAVALILAMHGLGLYFLLLPARQFQHYTEVAFMTLMPPRPMPRALPMIVPQPVTAPVRRGRSLPPATVAKPGTPGEAITAVPEATVPESAPPAPAGDLRTRALLAAGGVDKSLRGELKQDKPWLAAPALSGDSKFAALVASAWRGGPAVKLEDYLTADGRPGTRVVTATGAACYAMQANPLAGADPFNTAGKVKQVPCP
ncbi:hypothetical protein [Janthinobacterium psychrotolerans]|uniref:Uncharacterized protein n=1 Tax=Janthinobacterium psychrotolerans TaxID=1747903 RepID=A0A1A7C6E9_9BURK|nr:hypothetical protein [Janthinobacterium psychrotolerans]OBV41292.1 hypothetical protein ASR47_102748 [Janthinobacterium psychrotolerans]